MKNGMKNRLLYFLCSIIFLAIFYTFDSLREMLKFFVDDAYIAFRFIDHAYQGHGLVFNPPPFMPVEGYTSFSWVMLLWGIWEVFGMEPPAASQILNYLFSIATLLVVFIFILKNEKTEKNKVMNLVSSLFVVLFISLNRNVVTWSTSGMETALANFFVVSWVLWANTKASMHSRYFLFILSLIASLAYLTRPEWLLLCLATGLIIGQFIFTDRSLIKHAPFVVSPFILNFSHLLWRKWYYGDWLPNTYYAKVPTPWPESGIRYTTLFIIENNLWPLIFLSFLGIMFYIRQSSIKSVWNNLNNNRFICSLLSVGVCIGQVAYYTLIAGGDVFEFRPYSYLNFLVIPAFYFGLKYLAQPWYKSRLAILIIFGASTLPIQWHQWIETNKLYQQTKGGSRVSGYKFVETADYVHSSVRPYFQFLDEIRTWLFVRLVAVPQREHQAGVERMQYGVPESLRKQYLKPFSELGYPVSSLKTIGWPGWVHPNVAIIDHYGLVDYHVARTQPNHIRTLAHDRSPPVGFQGCYLLDTLLTTYLSHGHARRISRNHYSGLDMEKVIADCDDFPWNMSKKEFASEKEEAKHFVAKSKAKLEVDAYRKWKTQLQDGDDISLLVSRPFIKTSPEFLWGQKTSSFYDHGSNNRLGESFRTLTIPKGTWEVKADLIIPKGLRLRVEPGAHLLIADNVKIVSLGVLEFKGTEASPITLEGQGSGFAGIYLHSKDVISQLFNVSIKNVQGFSALTKNSAALNVFDSKLDINRLNVVENHAEQLINSTSSWVRILNSQLIHQGGLVGNYSSLEINTTVLKTKNRDTLTLKNSKFDSNHESQISASNATVIKGEGNILVRALNLIVKVENGTCLETEMSYLPGVRINNKFYECDKKNTQKFCETGRSKGCKHFLKDKLVLSTI